MRIIIAGSRSINHYNIVIKATELFLKKYKITEIVSGGAYGIDKLGERYAKENKILTKVFIPDWKIGKHAGILRNEQMGKYANGLIAIWDGESRGTKHMIDYAIKRGLLTYVFKYNKNTFEIKLLNIENEIV